MPDTEKAVTPVATVAAFLDMHNVLNLATADSDGPWSAAVFYARDRDQLVFLSAPHTRHIQNLAHTSRVAGTIQDEHSDWQAITGLQLEGHCECVTDDDRARIIDLYAAKFDVTGPNAPEPIKKALTRIGWYAIRIERLYYIDNRLGLGHREVVDTNALAH